MTKTRGSSGRRSGDGVVTCALVGRDRLLLDVLGGMLRLRRGVRIVAVPEEPAAGRVGPAVDLVVADVDGRGTAWMRPVRNLLAGGREPRLILVAPAAGECPRPRWLAAVAHAVVAREGGFPALLAAVERLCGDRLPARSAAEQPTHRHVPLTDREAEVLSLLGDGLTTKEIARRLDRSPLTIQTHRKRIVAKIGRLGSTTAARTVALRRSHFVGG